MLNNETQIFVDKFKEESIKLFCLEKVTKIDCAYIIPTQLEETVKSSNNVETSEKAFGTSVAKVVFRKTLVI